MKPGQSQLQWVVTFSMLLIFRASATVLYVDLNSTNPTPPYADWSTAATNIQAAINAASVLSSDTVLVSNGTYFENLGFGGKVVTVTSVNGPHVTIIDGRHAGPVVNFSSGEGVGSIIKGFTIQNGYNWLGSGMTLLGTSPTIIGNIFQNNAQEDGYYGAAIGGNNASPIIEQNLFQNNSADSQYLSGVVSFVNGSSPFIADNVFYNNTCRAINLILPSGTAPIVINNTIVSNSVGINANIIGNTGVFYNNILYGNNVGLAASPGTIWKNNLVFGGQTLYQSIADQTGINGNISTNPFFASLPGGDFHLLDGSPCIDAGTNGAPQLPAVDFDGYPRILAGRTNDSAIVDMGAYEFHTPYFILIQVQPLSQTLFRGQSASFNVAAISQYPLSYQWQFNGTNIDGATNSILTLTNVQPADAGSYSVTVTNLQFSLASSNAVLTVVDSSPAIVSQPTNQTVTVGNAANFSVAASGSLPLCYQWKFDGTNIFGATNTTLTLTNVQGSQAGNYTVLVTNLLGSILSSNAVLTVTLHHFAWDPIPSPRYVNTPFAVTLRAQNPTNGLFTNFTGTALLETTNGMAVTPSVSGNFVQGVWTGSVVIAQTASNLVLQADDGLGHLGLANPINVISLPRLGMSRAGNIAVYMWPVGYPGFVLETSGSILAPVAWTVVPYSPVQVGDQYLLPLHMTGTNGYYRLRFPGP